MDDISLTQLTYFRVCVIAFHPSGPSMSSINGEESQILAEELTNERFVRSSGEMLSQNSGAVMLS